MLNQIHSKFVSETSGIVPQFRSGMEISQKAGALSETVVRSVADAMREYECARTAKDMAEAASSPERRQMLIGIAGWHYKNAGGKFRKAADVLESADGLDLQDRNVKYIESKRLEFAHLADSMERRSANALRRDGKPVSK